MYDGLMDADFVDSTRDGSEDRGWAYISDTKLTSV